MVFRSFSRTFAAVMKFQWYGKRYLYDFVAYLEQCFYDFRLVWSSAAAADGCFCSLASLSGHLLFMDDSVLRILLSGAGQQAGLCGKWRPVQLGAAEGYPGVHLAGSVCRGGQFPFPARAVPLESCGSGIMLGCSGVFCFYGAIVPHP